MGLAAQDPGPLIIYQSYQSGIEMERIEHIFAGDLQAINRTKVELK